VRKSNNEQFASWGKMTAAKEQKYAVVCTDNQFLGKGQEKDGKEISCKHKPCIRNYVITAG